MRDLEAFYKGIEEKFNKDTAAEFNKRLTESMGLHE